MLARVRAMFAPPSPRDILADYAEDVGLLVDQLTFFAGSIQDRHMRDEAMLAADLIAEGVRRLEETSRAVSVVQAAGRSC